MAVALLFLLRIQMDFVKKRIFLSLNQIILIIRYKNPLRQLSAEELADSINYVNEIRMKKCLKEDLKNTANWVTRLIETRSELNICMKI